MTANGVHGTHARAAHCSARGAMSRHVNATFPTRKSTHTTSACTDTRTIQFACYLQSHIPTRTNTPTHTHPRTPTYTHSRNKSTRANMRSPHWHGSVTTHSPNGRARESVPASEWMDAPLGSDAEKSHDHRDEHGQGCTCSSPFV